MQQCFSHHSVTGQWRTLLGLVLLSICFAADAQDPRNKDECLSALTDPLAAECSKRFAGTDQSDSRKQCIALVAPQVEMICEQFFGAGVDFCATCTRQCTDTIHVGSPERKECLAMCLNHQSC